MRPLVALLVGAFAFAGCASTPEVPEIPQIPNVAPQEEGWTFEEAMRSGVGGHDDLEEPETTTVVTEVPVVEYRSPAPTVEAGPPEDPRNVVTNQVELFTIVPEERDFLGGAVVYNYVPRSVYKVFTSPLRVTNIELEAGETLESPPASGDTLNFQVATALSTNRRGERITHLLIKPVYGGRRTTLLVYTNRRIYQLELESHDEVFMPYVAFRYPLDSVEIARQEAATKREEIYLNGNIEAFDFGYEIVYADPHKPRWAPSVVFTDGIRTYMQFASAYRAAYAPVLFEVSRDGSRQLVNYRVVGDYYIVSSVIDRAELVLDINAGNIITIVRRR